MPKDLSLMILTCVIPTPLMHELDKILEQARAREIMWRPYRNGADEPAQVSDSASTVARSEAQQAWLAKHVKGEMRASEIRKAWIAAGFAPHSIYGSLTRAVKNKLIKKVKSGIYRGL